MARYRKKPVVIEAMEFTEESKDRVFNFVQGNRYADHTNAGAPVLVLHTLEGDMTARLGDFIIKGIKGEFYPCKPDIFEATYELVEEDN
jgi:hypothetical protein